VKHPLEPAYVLHARPFSETSLIVDVLTRHHGRLNLMAKGAKRPKSTKQALLQPFYPVLIAWAGRSELQTLTTIESRDQANRLQGNALMCGLYVNELLVKILGKHDPYPQLYDAYEHIIRQLSVSDNAEQYLRRFELTLVKQLGYELSAYHVEPDAYYMFSIDSGFVKVIRSVDTTELFKGLELISVLHVDCLSADSLPIAKRLMRVVLRSLLQGKSINSRELFILMSQDVKL